MSERQLPIEPHAAWQRLAERLRPLGSEQCSRQAGVGRVLARDLFATVDVPGHDVSAMDGYALDEGAVQLARDEAPVPVVGLSAAGDEPGAVHERGSARRIMTGAPVPTGADRILQIEHSAAFAGGNAGESEPGHDEPSPEAASIRVLQIPELGMHIRRAGEVAKLGEPILRAGSLLTAGTTGLLATHGHREIAVFARPRVAFLTTGNEVVDPDQVPGPGQLRDSHSDFFLAAGAQLGLETERLGIATDDLSDLRAKIERGLRCQVLLISGGVSKGDFDFVEDVLRDHGCEVLFDAIAIQPGKPMVAAQHPGGWVFALPGNPASAMVTFWLLVRPALRCLMGHQDGYWREALRGVLAAPLPGAKGRDRFLPATVRFSDGRPLVEPLVPLGSHDVAAYAHGTALVRIPKRSEPAPVGSECEILPLVEWPPDTVVR